MCVTAVAGITSHHLWPDRKHARARKVRVDLTDQQNHLAREVVARVDIVLLRATTMAIGAIHTECVAEFTHDGIGTVHLSVRRENLQADTGSLRERPITERVAAVVELLWCHGLGLHAAAMAGEAIHFVIPGREHTVTALKARVDEPHYADHLARRVLLVIAVARHVPLYVTVRALYAECFVEELHDERDVRVWRQ